MKVLDEVASLGDAELTSAQVTLQWSAGLEQRMGSVGTARAAEALAGAQPPWQASEVLLRLRDFNGGLAHCGEESAAMGDLCVGQAVESVFGGWLGLFG